MSAPLRSLKYIQPAAERKPRKLYANQLNLGAMISSVPLTIAAIKWLLERGCFYPRVKTLSLPVVMMVGLQQKAELVSQLTLFPVIL